MSQSPSGGGRSPSAPPPAPAADVQRLGLRPALLLEELLEHLVAQGLLQADQAKSVQGRATTLKSAVLKERVGSVRSQAATRYDASPMEIVAAANLPHPKESARRVDEDAIAKALAAASGRPFLKIDPLKIDSQLVAKTLSRPFARRHVVVAVGRDAEGLLFAVADPFD